MEDINKILDHIDESALSLKAHAYCEIAATRILRDVEALRALLVAPSPTSKKGADK